MQFASSSADASPGEVSPAASVGAMRMTSDTIAALHGRSTARGAPIGLERP